MSVDVGVFDDSTSLSDSSSSGVICFDSGVEIDSETFDDIIVDSVCDSASLQRGHSELHPCLSFICLVNFPVATSKPLPDFQSKQVKSGMADLV